MKSNSNLFRKWFGYLITHSPELCPEKQGYAGSKVLRIKKPSNEETILLCSLKRSPEASLLLWDRKIGCSFYVLGTQLWDNIPKLSGRGSACWGPWDRKGENKPLRWPSVFLCLSQALHIPGPAGFPRVYLKAIHPGHSFQESFLKVFITHRKPLTHSVSEKTNGWFFP